MRSPSKSSSLTPANIFSPAFLAAIRERDEAITAAEAEFAGPWRCEAVVGRPGLVAVLQQWESLDHGDVPKGIFWHPERALLMTALLPALGREPLFHLCEESGSDGFAITAVYGEQGSQVAGWVPRYEPEVVQGLHILECLARSPVAAAAVLEAAGWGAIDQIGRILARRMMP